MNTGVRILSETDLRDVTTTKQTEYGAQGVTADGRKFRYVGAGASALTAGHAVVAAAKVANHENVAVAADAKAGDRTVRVTLGATAVTEGQYTEGFMVVNDGAGEGRAYQLSGNQAGVASDEVTLYLAEPLSTDLSSTGSEVTLTTSPYAAVVESSTVGEVVGVAAADIPAGNFGWAQTGGLVSVLAQGAVTKGAPIVQSTTTAGAVKVAAAVTEQVVGVAREALVSGEMRQATLTLE